MCGLWQILLSKTARYLRNEATWGGSCLRCHCNCVFVFLLNLRIVGMIVYYAYSESLSLIGYWEIGKVNCLGNCSHEPDQFLGRFMKHEVTQLDLYEKNLWISF